MNNALIIHGFGSNPNEHWIPWLKHELENQSYDVLAPEFPDTNHPKLENWLKYNEQFQDTLSNSIMIGHSLGGTFILRFLEQCKIKIQHAYLIAIPIHLIGNEKFDPVIKNFFEKDFDWDTIRQHCNNFTIFHGDNDPYVPISHAKDLAHHLNGDLHIIKNGGHLNTTAGYTTFPELLKTIIKN